MARSPGPLARLVAGVALACSLAATEARAEPPATGPSATLGSGTGGGERHVEIPDTAARPSTPAAPASASPARKTPAPTHRRGKAPKEPKATLPADVPATPPSLAQRRGVAQGPIAEEGRGGPADPELTALHQAELVLFPRPLAGFVPGWSWELPAPLEGAAPAVSADGFPPAPEDAAPQGDTDPAVVDEEWLRSLTMPNLPVRFDPRVVKYLHFYRDDPQGRAIARAWAKKSGRLTAALRSALAKAGVPTDLVWLSLIESGHNPTIRSPAGAAGLWQFVPESARMYGLVVDRWVDERLDPRRATEAAAAYLSDLYQRFGSWDLAMAAYNMGHGGMSRAIAKYNTNDFWELSRHEAGIPWETTLYVPKILATAIVMANRKAFGIDDVVPDEEIKFDTVLVSPGVSLSRVAAAAEVSVAVVEEQNPQYLAERVPPGEAGASRWAVAVPKGRGIVAARKLAAADAGSVDPYRVRFGDTAAAVADSVGTTEARIRELNGIRAEERLEAGTVLLVPRGARVTPSAGEPPVIVVASSRFEYADRRCVFYPVRKGDRVDEVATAFGVEPAEVLLWNALDPAARLQPGMTLQLYVPTARSLDEVRYVEAKGAQVLVAGTPEFIDHFEGLKGRQRLVVTAQAGDTLASIGERFGMSVGSMERVNRRSRRDPVVAGEALVVYTERPEPPSARSAPAAGEPSAGLATTSLDARAPALGTAAR